MAYRVKNGSALKERWDDMTAGTMAMTKHGGIGHVWTLQNFAGN
jgi:hypothetical protein